jgi:Tfp pilus assembly protein PilO
MTSRDRLVLIGLGALAMLAAVYLLVVAPERKQASTLSGQVAAASAQLASAQGEVASARADQTRYAAEYASIVRLGKAVPASQEMPSLMYQLAHASNQKHVDFTSISTGASGAGSTSGSTANAPDAAAASAGFSQLPFTFVFNGSFNDLYHLFQEMNQFTTRSTSGHLQVSGRLLTIQSTKLAPAPATTVSHGKAAQRQSAQRLMGTITATAYVLPGTQTLTGGATPGSPTGASATPASGTGSTSSPSAPAIARVTP